MSKDSEEIRVKLKDDSQLGTDLEVVIGFDQNSCISIRFPSLSQADQENPVVAISLDYFNAEISILVYRENDDEPQKIPITRNSQRTEA